MTAPNAKRGLICVGASAGGLRSLEAVLSRVPKDLPWPVLVSQHLQHDRVSQLPEILARVVAMPVREAVEGEVPHAGTIYTSPASAELGVRADGRLALRPPVQGVPQRIDHLFATAAFALPGRVVAVVLSGTGNDGAVGSLVVKLNGGVVVVESAETAEHTGMPEAAERAGTVDATLNAPAIASLIVDLAGGKLEATTEAARAVLRQIAHEITRSSGTDFTAYRAGTLRRRVENRRAIVGMPTIEAYRDLVASDSAERARLVRSLLIPVTEFFRDPEAWRALDRRVFPTLAERAAAGLPVRIWCAGCATGEEAYTIAILAAENLPSDCDLRILATDLDDRALAAASEGVYDAARLAGVDPARRARFFVAEGSKHHVVDDLRKRVQFLSHDLTADAPPGEFDLVVCRNVLIYFEPDLQAQTIRRFQAAIAPRGFLFLGQSEAIPAHRASFAPVVRSMRIFRTTRGASPNAAEAHGHRDASPTASAWAPAHVDEPDTLLLSLDPEGLITLANARARLILGRDVRGSRLFDVFPDWEGTHVDEALRGSMAGGRGLRVRNAPTPWGPLDLTFEPLPEGARGLLLIGIPVGSGPLADPATEVREARHDLSAANDELQSANEELAATNEELQRANEEMASLNVESQATNDALAAANAELKFARGARRDPIREFMDVRRDAVVACDPQRRVLFFNARAAEILGLGPGVVGQPLQLAALGVGDVDLAARLAEAKSAQARIEVPARDGGDIAIEWVVDQSDRPLGWVLTWNPTR